MRRAALAYASAAGGVFLLFHTDNLPLKAAALLALIALEGYLALQLPRLRLLLLADAAVTVFVTALLIVAPAAFALYRWGWLAHAGIAAGLLALSDSRLSPKSYRVLIGFSALALPGALLLLPPHDTLVELTLALWTAGGLPLIGAGLLGDDRAVKLRLPLRLAALIAIALGCALSLRSLRAFPNFSATDEAMIVNYVDTFARTGAISSTLIPYPAPVVTGNLYIAAAALWTRLTPGDPFALRWLSALASLVLLGVTFLAGRALDDALTGWLAAALLAANLLWLAVAHIGRQEMALAACIWLAVWLALAAQRRSSHWLALLAGLTVALSADVHPLGALACVAMGAWWLIPLRRRGFAPSPYPARLVIAFAAGGLLGAAYYAAAHILPDPAAFVAGVRDELVSYGAEGSTPPGALIARHLSYVQANPLEAGLLLVGALLGLRQRAGRRIGLFVAALLALYGTLVADPNPYYPIVWMPGVILGAVIGLRRTAPRWRAPLLVALLAAFVFNAALIERHVRADWNGLALAAIEQVAARAPAGRGLGETFLYLTLRRPDFTGFTFVNYWAADAGISRWDVVDKLRPDWIVTMQDERPFAPEFNVLSVAVPHLRLEIPAPPPGYMHVERLATDVGTFEIWTR